MIFKKYYFWVKKVTLYMCICGIRLDFVSGLWKFVSIIASLFAVSANTRQYAIIIIDRSIIIVHSRALSSLFSTIVGYIFWAKNYSLTCNVFAGPWYVRGLYYYAIHKSIKSFMLFMRFLMLFRNTTLVTRYMFIVIQNVRILCVTVFQKNRFDFHVIMVVQNFSEIPVTTL